MAIGRLGKLGGFAQRAGKSFGRAKKLGSKYGKKLRKGITRNYKGLKSGRGKSLGSKTRRSLRGLGGKARGLAGGVSGKLSDKQRKFLFATGAIGGGAVGVNALRKRNKGAISLNRSRARRAIRQQFGR